MKLPAVPLTAEQLDALVGMLAELNSNSLEYTLVPSDDKEKAKRGAKIRVVVSRNADWYVQFCADYPRAGRRKTQKPDTLINRRDTIAALQRMLEKKIADTSYAHRILQYVPGYLERNKAQFEAEKRAYENNKNKKSLPAQEPEDWEPF